ncbi:UDP-N-acetylmuramate dehydrogenase [Microbacterium sp. ru370.1]|nr:UDP-N-acetylmuramate dehydrogenase [Microbacterium sp. ru370.1]
MVDDTDDLRMDLAAIRGVKIAFDVSLAGISRWAIGGPARAVVSAVTAEGVEQTLRTMRDRRDPFLVVGETSNLLFDSEGFDGVILRVGRGFDHCEIQETTVRAEAGISIPQLARLTADAGLSGLEHTVGIPGTLGGLVTMNGGSQRRGIGSHVGRVVYIDSDGRRGELSQEECRFAYRRSVLQEMNVVVVEVDLNLDRADAAVVHRSMDAVVESRRSRFPEHLPNCGSTFLSDPEMYATVGPPGRAIEDVGLKGFRRGGAQISEQHANFIVNTGGATSDDVLWLIAKIRRDVMQATGFAMDCEVRYVNKQGEVSAAHEAAQQRWPGGTSGGDSLPAHA